MDLKIKEYKEIESNVLDELCFLEGQIFEEPYTKNKLEREASVKNNLLILVAYQNDQACAYKAGFELSSRMFYSWIGGVLPSHRNLGLAKSLMAKQHQVAKQWGYSCVRTNTENKYREMLILNLKSGFDVIGVYKSDHDLKQTIMLEKMLS